MNESDIDPNLVEAGQNSESNPPRTSKALVAAVIIMGVMIILGTVLLVGIIIHRMMNHAATPSTPATAQTMMGPSSLAGPALLTLPRHADEQIMAVTARPDGALAVTLRDGQGNARILLWQPEQARLVAELKVAGPAGQ